VRFVPSHWLPHTGSVVDPLHFGRVPFGAPFVGEQMPMISEHDSH
jgi:hypothetical protein